MPNGRECRQLVCWIASDFSGGPQHIKLIFALAIVLPLKNVWYEFGDGDINHGILTIFFLIIGNAYCQMAENVDKSCAGLKLPPELKVLMKKIVY